VIKQIEFLNKTTRRKINKVTKEDLEEMLVSLEQEGSQKIALRIVVHGDPYGPEDTRCYVWFIKKPNMKKGKFDVGLFKGNEDEINMILSRGRVLISDMMTQKQLIEETGLVNVETRLEGCNGFAFYADQTVEQIKLLSDVAATVAANCFANWQRGKTQQRFEQTQGSSLRTSVNRTLH
jgi:hypothetical protein